MLDLIQRQDFVRPARREQASPEAVQVRAMWGRVLFGGSAVDPLQALRRAPEVPAVRLSFHRLDAAQTAPSDTPKVLAVWLDLLKPRTSGGGEH